MKCDRAGRLFGQIPAPAGFARVVAEDPVVVAGDPDQLRVDQVLDGRPGSAFAGLPDLLAGRADPGGRGLAGEQVVQPLAHHHVLEQRHRPLLLQHDHGVAADRLQPVAELLGDWLETVRGNTVVVLEEKRPVPLFQHVMVGQAAARPVRR